MKCGAKLEFRPALVASTELQFSVEAWFAGEKTSDGIGRTRRDAQDKASEYALKNLARFYISGGKSDTNANDGGFVSNVNPFGRLYSPREEFMSFAVSSESSRPMDPRSERYRRSMDPVSALKELCMVEDLGLVFQPSPSANLAPKDEMHAQVEVEGQVLGKGIGLSWDEAAMQAAEKALCNIRSMTGQFPTKRQGSPRFVQGMANKRTRPEFPQPAL